MPCLVEEAVRRLALVDLVLTEAAAPTVLLLIGVIADGLVFSMLKSTSPLEAFV